MAYEICKSCGGMFEKSGREYCGICYGEHEKEYKLVLDYIESNPDNTVLDISIKTKVPLKTINRLIEDGSISYKATDRKTLK